MKLIACLFVAATLMACHGSDASKQAAPSEQKPARATIEQIDSPSMQFLPRLGQAPGWRLKGDPEVYSPESLPGYLGLDARHFLLYDVSDLTVGEYERVGAPGFATLEIFRFPDFVKAFGTFSTRRIGRSTPLNLANQSFALAHSIHLWRGPFYVRITGGGDADVNSDLVKLAGSVAERMPTAPSLPPVFTFMPDKFRVPDSEQFTAEAAFGQPFLRGSFTVQYDVAGTKVDGLIFPAAGRPEAKRTLDQFKGFFVANGKLLDPVPNLGEDNFTAEDRSFGRVVAIRLDRFVIAFRSYGDRQGLVDLASQADQRIIGTIRKQLVSADEAAENPRPEVSTAPPWIASQTP